MALLLPGRYRLRGVAVAAIGAEYPIAGELRLFEVRGLMLNMWVVWTVGVRACVGRLGRGCGPKGLAGRSG